MSTDKKSSSMLQRIEKLEQMIELRPTHLQAIASYLGMIGILSGIFYFIFNGVLDTKLKAQAEVVSAKTSLALNEAIRTHEYQDYSTWESRKSSIVAAVIEKLKLRR